MRNVSVMEKTIIIQSDIANIKEVREEIIFAMSSCGFDGESQMSVAVALDECLTNAIRHGNKNRHELGVEIKYRICAASVEITVRDSGRGFNWRGNMRLSGGDDFTGYELGGRGLFMINSMMTSVKYNDAGNEVTISKITRA